MDALVAPVFLKRHALLTLRERVKFYNDQLRPTGAKKTTVYYLRKLYRQHGIKCKQLKMLRQPDRLEFNAISRLQKLAELQSELIRLEKLGYYVYQVDESIFQAADN
jgi:hypothetical protein